MKNFAHICKISTEKMVTVCSYLVFFYVSYCNFEGKSRTLQEFFKDFVEKVTEFSYIMNDDQAPSKIISPNCASATTKSPWDIVNMKIL